MREIENTTISMAGRLHKHACLCGCLNALSVTFTTVLDTKASLFFVHLIYVGVLVKNGRKMVLNTFYTLKLLFFLHYGYG